jgi:hypothetical protein
MATLLDLADDMDKMSVLIGLRSRDMTKFVALRVITYLIEQTPVDVSTALSNWAVAVSGSSYGASPIPAYVPGIAGSSAEASAQQAVEAAKAALKAAQPKKALAIINAVPYLKRLNEGWSSQHPGGFVEASILVGKRAVKEYNFNKRLAQDIRRGSVKPDG